MNSSLTLRELNSLIKSTIEYQFDSPLWIVAEINNITEHRNGHCYLELIQKSETQDIIIAQTRAVIWSTQYRFISSYFEAITNKKLTKGIKVLVKVSVDFHELYGLSLNIRDIDPSYTLGDLEKQRKEIIERLRIEGVIDMNRSILMPSVVQKIAVISSGSAAGFEDFVKQLSSNKYGYVYDITLFEADMQGSNTEKTIIATFNSIFEDHDKFDIVAIIRGGGSKSDLSFFDNYNIAFYITQFPLPVFSGIGHERDESVTDIVAHTKLKTPTAVADYIIEHNLKFENSIDYEYDNIVNRVNDLIKTHELYLTGLGMRIYRTKDILVKNIERCNKLYYKLHNLSVNRIKERDNNLKTVHNYITRSISVLLKLRSDNLEQKYSKIKNVKDSYLDRESNKLNIFEYRTRLLSPENILKRGYSMSIINGKIIKDISHVNEGDIMKTVFYKGKISSKIIKDNKSE